MPLFSSLLSDQWARRALELNAQRLQAHNDMLYEHLRRDFTARARDLQDSLIEAIRTASSKADLMVPLWTFNSTYIANWAESRRDAMAFAHFEGRLRNKGYEWSIGRVRPAFDPEFVDTTSWTWEWDSTPATVYRVIRRTDLLTRLALLFGDRYTVTTEVVATKPIHEPFEAQVYRTELRLHYFPDGLPTATRNLQEVVRQKYANYRAPVDEAFVHLWTGKPSQRDPVVVREPPGFSNLPPSPVPSAAPSEPPQLPRRTNGGGIQALSDGGSARRLDFGSIHVYEGEDALERAARDTLASAQDDSAPCHCGYHHPEW